jgi:hypothetical protein
MKDPLSDLSGGRHAEPVRVDPAKIRSRRNLVMALALGAFVILVFVVTLVRLKGNVGHF